MNNIEINSVESVILFVLYICIQDGKISDEELNELAEEFPLIEKLYFDIYGEYVHHDFQKMLFRYSSPLLSDTHVSICMWPP